MAIAEIVTGIKTTYAAAAAAIEARDGVKLNEIKADFLSQLVELYTAAFALAETNAALAKENRDLESQLVELGKKIDERSRYELAQPYPGTTVFRLKDTDTRGEPMHYLCPQCLEAKSLKSILQLNGSMNTATWGTCQHCKSGFRFGEHTIKTARSDYDPYGGD